MELRFVSSLTPDEEERFVPTLLAVVSGLLDQTSLAYTLQIRTSGDRVFHHTRTAIETVAEDPDDSDSPSPPGAAGTNGRTTSRFPPVGKRFNHT